MPITSVDDNGIHLGLFVTCKADGQSAITSAASLSDLIFITLALGLSRDFFRLKMASLNGLIFVTLAYGLSCNLLFLGKKLQTLETLFILW